MQIGKYKINSSVIIASAIAFIGSIIDLATSGQLVGILADVIMYFLHKPESFKPYLTDKIYRFLLTFLPLLIIILRNTNVRYKPPIEKID